MTAVTSKVLITGASGFIGKHIVREALARGHAVRGTVRSGERQAEVEALFPDADIEFARVDLTADDGWDQALDGVDSLIHTASPLPLRMPSSRQDLIDPAVEGTLRALRAAHAAGTHRVVVTSSVAAVFKETGKPRHASSDETNWTDPDGVDTTAYEASKVLAERAAWEFVAEHPKMQLTVLNPGMVLGPPLDEHYGMSLQVIERFIGGRDQLLPRVDIPIVDVRDVARVHIGVLGEPATVGERIALNAGTLDTVDAVRTIAAVYPQRRIPARPAPDWLIRLAGRFSPLARQAVGNLDRNCHVDGSKAERLMRFTYVPAERALLASAEFIAARES